MEINKNGAVSNGWMTKTERECVSVSKTAAHLGVGVASWAPRAKDAPALLVCRLWGNLQHPTSPPSIHRKVVSLVAMHILQLFLKDKAETSAMQGTSTFTAGYFLESTCESDLIIRLFSHMVGAC